MSTRRPRVKAAAILKPRRPLNANESNAADKAIKSEQVGDEQITSGPANDEDNTKVCDDCNGVGHVDDKIEEATGAASSDAAISVENKPPKSSPPQPPPPQTPAAPFRRISTPPVNRRRSIVAENRAANCPSPKYIRSPSYSFVSQVKLDTAKPPPQPSTADEEVFSPVSNEFKSPPFMSPIYTPRRVADPAMSPFHDIYGEDCNTKSPSQAPNNASGASSASSNAKLRQRIRPNLFASRRNSIGVNSMGGGSGGGGCESEDEQYRRQRHYSTSSNHSNYNPASTPQHQRNYFGLNKIPARVRTESYSSNISDMPFSKAKRSHRSEEYQRIAHAKREFNQRLNGKPPDKTRLTMYDLIYYNPLTNPMSKPAGKGGSGDGKMGDAASMASAKTTQSRASIKSHASVKSERSESSSVRNAATNAGATAAGAPNSLVPQLKLDVNGEIILDEKSLVIETTANKEAREVLASSDVVYDDEFSGSKYIVLLSIRNQTSAVIKHLAHYIELRLFFLSCFCSNSKRLLQTAKTDTRLAPIGNVKILSISSNDWHGLFGDATIISESFEA